MFWLENVVLRLLYSVNTDTTIFCVAEMEKTFLKKHITLLCIPVENAFKQIVSCNSSIKIPEVINPDPTDL